jgi:hypothetical protein
MSKALWTSSFLTVIFILLNCFGLSFSTPWRVMLSFSPHFLNLTASRCYFLSYPKNGLDSYFKWSMSVRGDERWALKLKLYTSRNLWIYWKFRLLWKLRSRRRRHATVLPRALYASQTHRAVWSGFRALPTMLKNILSALWWPGGARRRHMWSAKTCGVRYNSRTVPPSSPSIFKTGSHILSLWDLFPSGPNFEETPMVAIKQRGTAEAAMSGIIETIDSMILLLTSLLREKSDILIT